MKLTIKLLIASLVLIFSLSACGEIFDEGDYDYDYESPETEEYTEEEDAEDESYQEEEATEAMSCPVITDQIIELAVYGSEGEEDLLDEELVIVTYVVNGDEISEPTYEDVPADLLDEQENTELHQQLWEYYAALIPAEQRGMIAEYAITTDGVGGTLASVAQTTYDPDLWTLNIDIADTANYYELTSTLVHEFAHLLTLGPDQVVPSLAVLNNPEDNNIYLQELSACPNYFPGEGCANADSYIDDFYFQFWEELRDEWDPINLEEDEDTRTELLDEFYSQYEDRFVTSYAATNPEEDIAESFAFFVFSPKPAGDTILEEKILFFYNYPELVELRASILNNTCANFPE
ncbi:MAG: hypothetical protein Q8L87_11675 [Anaerolineales bacterium]|nr:hypothetical protein [Anaerolineales bacterium]